MSETLIMYFVSCALIGIACGVGFSKRSPFFVMFAAVTASTTLATIIIASGGF